MRKTGSVTGSRYKSMAECIRDLETHGHLVRYKDPVSPDLELAEIQRRLYVNKGPAVLFENVEGTSFPCLANLYGQKQRLEFIFRDTIEQVKLAISLRTDPKMFAVNAAKQLWRQPLEYIKVPFTGLTSLPMKSREASSPVMEKQTTLTHLPQIKCWPDDGGPFITLPQVFSQASSADSIMKSNLGMYRVQIAGNDYIENKEVGLHYQIHRGIGIHHHAALERGEDLPVSIFVGGPPAHTFAAVMPLPESLSELIFGGMLAGRRFRYTKKGPHIISADADFCITGWIRGKKTKPEGPFGDHLGYYSLTHEFPYLEIENVYHRRDAVWPFTVVGRPPQEDSEFGAFIHDLTGNIVSYEIPGVKALHAVDETGVHPLLLAIGTERYLPYEDGPPQEILTQANAILGFNQCSLAKYLFIATDIEGLDIQNVKDFILHMLERVDFSRDLHFQTKTTIDTLDYSGENLNAGSKLVVAAGLKKIRELKTQIPNEIINICGENKVVLVAPGILAISAKEFENYETSSREIKNICDKFKEVQTKLEGFALITIVDDVNFIARSFENFLWTTFTRSNPSHDIYGIGESIKFKHWGCTGPLVIDARSKGHHAPALLEDPHVASKVDAIASRNTIISRYL